jgi:hypothetical protein
MDMFWIVALNNVVGCLRFFLRGLVDIDGKIMAQPLRDRRLGNILTRTPNPMSTRGFDVTTLASLANGSSLGVILSSAGSQLSGNDTVRNHDSSGLYRRRRLGPGETSLTQADKVVIANVLLFRVYGAIKIWHDYSNHFASTPPSLSDAQEKEGSCRPVFGVAGFSVEEMEHLARFF